MYSTNSRDSKAFYQAREARRREQGREEVCKPRTNRREEPRTNRREEPRTNRREEPRTNRREEPPKSQVPTANQIHNLVKQVFEPYDPEDWSILDKRDQQVIHKIVYHTPLMDLSIRRVLQVSRFSDTPSTVAFITDCIRRKFNSVTQ
jgi:hypothetical protein